MRISVRHLKKLIATSLNEIAFEKNKTFKLSSSSSDSKDHEQEIFDMIQASYAPIGGHLMIKSKSDVAKEFPTGYVADVDDDPEVDVFLGVKGQDNRKISASATDGTATAKAYAFNMRKQMYDDGFWAEVSDATAHIALNKMKIPSVKDQDKVETLIQKSVEWHGEHPEGKFPGTYGWYSRDIGGVKKAKILVGNV